MRLDLYILPQYCIKVIPPFSACAATLASQECLSDVVKGRPKMETASHFMCPENICSAHSLLKGDFSNTLSTYDV